MEIVWLREQDMHCLTYRRGAVGGDENPRPIEKDRYVPSYCNSDGFCSCGLPKPGDACDVCDSDMFRLVKSSCLKGKTDKDLLVLLQNN